MKLKTSFQSSFAVLTATLLSLSMVSCGPVNQKPATDLSKQNKTMCDPQVPTDLAATPSPSGSPTDAPVSYSQNEHFIVSALLADVDSGQNPSEKPSPMTDNLYFIRFVSGRNLSQPSADAQLTVQYIHTMSIGPPDIYSAVATRQGDHFAVTIHYGQSGNYALHLHLTDGAIQDDHVVYVNP
jgi:hypothetical protein